MASESSDFGNANVLSSEGNIGSAENCKDRVSSPPHLLVIVGEPFNADQKTLIVERLQTELSAWDQNSSGCCLDEQLARLVSSNLQPTSTSNGDLVIESKSEHLYIEILINPHLQTTINRTYAFLSDDAGYRHLLYSGLSFEGSGSWLLQDGPLTFASVCDIFSKGPVGGSGWIDVSAFENGDWSAANFAKLAPGSRVRLNPAKVPGQFDGVASFSSFLSSFLNPVPLTELMPASDTVGNFPCHRPTLYVFDGGDGSSSLFGIRGFKLMVDGGYQRRPCFWPLVKHLESVDTLLVTHISPNNVLGVASILEHISLGNIHPNINPMFLNASDADKYDASKSSGSGLLLNLLDKVSSFIGHTQRLNVDILPFTAESQNHRIRLFSNIGYGSLDMFVINPSADSKELKDLLAKVSRSCRLSQVDHLSACSVVVFQPSDHQMQPTRILFSGATPQSKIFEGLERLKSLTLFSSASGMEKVAERVGAVKQTSKPSSKESGSPGGKTEGRDAKRLPDVHRKEIPASSKSSGHGTEGASKPSGHSTEGASKPSGHVTEGTSRSSKLENKDSVSANVVPKRATSDHRKPVAAKSAIAPLAETKKPLAASRDHKDAKSVAHPIKDKKPTGEAHELSGTTATSPKHAASSKPTATKPDTATLPKHAAIPKGKKVDDNSRKAVPKHGNGHENAKPSAKPGTGIGKPSAARKNAAHSTAKVPASGEAEGVLDAVAHVESVDTAALDDSVIPQLVAVTDMCPVDNLGISSGRVESEVGTDVNAPHAMGEVANTVPDADIDVNSTFELEQSTIDGIYAEQDSAISSSTAEGCEILQAGGISHPEDDAEKGIEVAVAERILSAFAPVVDAENAAEDMGASASDAAVELVQVQPDMEKIVDPADEEVAENSTGVSEVEHDAAESEDISCEDVKVEANMESNFDSPKSEHGEFDVDHSTPTDEIADEVITGSEVPSEALPVWKALEGTDMAVEELCASAERDVSAAVQELDEVTQETEVGSAPGVTGDGVKEPDHAEFKNHEDIVAEEPENTMVISADVVTHHFDPKNDTNTVTSTGAEVTDFESVQQKDVHSADEDTVARSEPFDVGSAIVQSDAKEDVASIGTVSAQALTETTPLVEEADVTSEKEQDVLHHDNSSAEDVKDVPHITIDADSVAAASEKREAEILMELTPCSSEAVRDVITGEEEAVVEAQAACATESTPTATEPNAMSMEKMSDEEVKLTTVQDTQVQNVDESEIAESAIAGADVEIDEHLAETNGVSAAQTDAITADHDVAADVIPAVSEMEPATAEGAVEGILVAGEPVCVEPITTEGVESFGGVNVGPDIVNDANADDTVEQHPSIGDDHSVTDEVSRLNEQRTDELRESSSLKSTGEDQELHGACVTDDLPVVHDQMPQLETKAASQTEEIAEPSRDDQVMLEHEQHLDSGRDAALETELGSGQTETEQSGLVEMGIAAESDIAEAVNSGELPLDRADAVDDHVSSSSDVQTGATGKRDSEEDGVLSVGSEAVNSVSNPIEEALAGGAGMQEGAEADSSIGLSEQARDSSDDQICPAEDLALMTDKRLTEPASELSLGDGKPDNLMFTDGTLEVSAAPEPIPEGAFDPLDAWDAPQSLPAPLEKAGGDKKSGDKSGNASKGGANKAPVHKSTLVKAKGLDDLNSTSVAAHSGASSSKGDPSKRTRLSLQPGELKSMSSREHSLKVDKKPAAHKPVVPFFVDVAYLPLHSSDPHYVTVDFFRHIRARYYVVSAANPDPRILEMLADAKPSWDEGSVSAEVTVIPTGNADEMASWYNAHHQQLSEKGIVLAPAASRCRIEFGESDCAAYRLEL